MKEGKKNQEAFSRASKIVWRIIGSCIIVATVAVGILYLQHQKQREIQLGYEPGYMTLADERAYCAIDWFERLESDIVYGQAQGTNGTEDLKLDVYRTSKEGPNPAIILFHGGGLTSGDKASAGLLKSLATDFARMGYVVIVPDYRLSKNAGDTALKNAMEDAKAAYEWVLANGEDYDVDTTHIAVGGYSSGADIAVNLCYSGIHEDLDRERIFAVIDISGSGLYYSMTDSVVPGCVIVHGTEDTTVRFSNGENVAEKLRNRGVDVNFHPLEGLNHDLLSRYDEVRNKFAEYL